MKKHLEIKISGVVQGVFFRYSAKRQAEKIGLCGFARNESDGSVYIEAEGEKGELEKFLEWCREGPPLASVSRVNFEFKDDLKNFKKFVIE